MKLFNLPDQFAFTVEQVAELLEVDPQTIRTNLKRPPTHRKYLKSFKPSEREFRIRHDDLRDFIERNIYNT